MLVNNKIIQTGLLSGEWKNGKNGVALYSNDYIIKNNNLERGSKLLTSKICTNNVGLHFKWRLQWIKITS